MSGDIDRPQPARGEARNLFWPGCRVRHHKGGEYVVLFRADYEPTMTDCYVYRGEDGHTWVRPAAQMEDGRFEYADEPAVQPRDAVTDSLWVELVVSGAGDIPAIRFWTGDHSRARDEISKGRPLREFSAEEALWNLLPKGSRYLDPPDGGNVPLIEQLRRMSEDAVKWIEHEKIAKRDEVSEATKILALAIAHIAHGIPDAKEVAADALSQAAALEAAARVRADHFVDANKIEGDAK